MLSTKQFLSLFLMSNWSEPEANIADISQPSGNITFQILMHSPPPTPMVPRNPVPNKNPPRKIPVMRNDIKVQVKIIPDANTQ